MNEVVLIKMEYFKCCTDFVSNVQSALIIFGKKFCTLNKDVPTKTIWKQKQCNKKRNEFSNLFDLVGLFYDMSTIRNKMSISQ